MSVEDAMKDLIDDRISEADLSDKIQDELPNFNEKIEEALKDHDFRDAISDALDDYDMDQDIGKALEHFDFSDAVSEAFSYDRRVQHTLKTEVRERVDDQVGEYVQSPEFVSLVRGVVVNVLWDIFTLKALRGKATVYKAEVIKFTKDQVSRLRKAA